MHGMNKLTRSHS